MCSGKVSNPCLTGGTRRVARLVTNQVIILERGKHMDIFISCHVYVNDLKMFYAVIIYH